MSPSKRDPTSYEILIELRQLITEDAEPERPFRGAVIVSGWLANATERARVKIAKEKVPKGDIEGLCG